MPRSLATFLQTLLPSTWGRVPLRLACLLWVGFCLSAQSITVTSAGDSGAGSLRQAIQDVASGGTITFDASLQNATLTLSSGELQIAKDLTIDGANRNVTLSGNNASRVFKIASGSVVMRGLTITRGNADSDSGGGIWNQGTLTLTDCTVSQNSASGGQGGGIWSQGTLTLTDCTVSQNSASGWGGGIYDQANTLTLTRCTLRHNSAENGGGVYQDGSTGVFLNCTLWGNSASQKGGGVYSISSSMLTNCTLSGNSADQGGGICAAGDNANLTVMNCTLWGNRASAGQGGAFMRTWWGTASFQNTLMGGSLTLDGSAKTANTFSSDVIHPMTGGGNLADDGTCGDTFTPFADLKLGLLADNGGPTQTHALLAGSPAIDAGLASAGLPRRDQRGWGRVGAPDVGAYEYGSAADTLGLSVSGNPSTVGQNVTLTATVAPGSTGSVSFFDGAMNLGSAPVDAAGSATLTTNSLAAGSHSLKATFGAGSSEILPHVVNNAPTTTTLTSSANPADCGQAVIFTAVVTGSGATGTVSFLARGVQFDAVALSGGMASTSLSTLAGGTYMITAVYSGDGLFAGSTSSGLLLMVNWVRTSTLLSASPNPSADGQSVTLTATVTGSGPTGSVIFRDGATTLGTGTLSGGTATLSSSALTLGSHSLTAAYGGDGYNSASTSPVLTQVVVQPTAITVINGLDSGAGSLRQAIQDIAPGGTITFAASLQNATLTLSSGELPIAKDLTIDGASRKVTLSGNNASRVFNIASGSVAMRGLTITRGKGDKGGGIYSVGTLMLTDCTVSQNSASVWGGGIYSLGNSLTLTDCTVSQNSAVDGGGIFQNGNTGVFLNCALWGNSASQKGGGILTSRSSIITNCTLSGNSADQGGGICAGGDSANLTVMNCTLWGNRASAGQGGALLRTGYGTASFQNTLMGGSLTLDGSAKTANTFSSDVIHPTTGAGNLADDGTCGDTFAQVADLRLGALADNGGPTQTHALLAGSPAIDAGLASAGLPRRDQRGWGRVGAPDVGAYEYGSAADTLGLSVSENPSTVGQNVTLTATVAPGSTGSVSFFDGAMSLGSAPVDAAGSATLTTNSLAAGSHSLKATFGAGSSEILSHVVNNAPTTTTLTSSLNPAYCGQAVIFTAVVTGSGATGTVSFLARGVQFDAVALSGGMASTSLSTLAMGTYTITAVYSGDGLFAGSTSSGLLLVVESLGTSTLLSAGPNPSADGQLVTLTATVTGSGPTGTVIFRDGATTLGTGTLSGGTATLSTSALVLGSHSLTASYSGDSYNAASTSAVLTQAVVQPTTITVTNGLDSGEGSLRKAIQDIAPGGTIIFAASYTIQLASQLVLGKDLTIDGTGHAVNLKGGTDIRAFKVNAGATVSLKGLTISGGNMEYSSGGGIWNEGTLTLTACTVSGNTAKFLGGGILCFGGTLTLRACTLSGNTANSGGGIVSEGGILTLESCTLVGNSADLHGGGIFVQGSGNSLTVNNTLFARGAMGDNSGSYSSPAWGPTGNNLSDDGSFGVHVTQVADLKLGLLADNGGPTQTHALLAGSPAIDAGNDATASSTDQRGIARPQGVHSDIGAYEFVDGTAPAVASFTATTPVAVLSIPITAFTATDNVSVTGYLITTSSIQPAVSDAGWKTTAPAAFDVAGDAAYTLFPWVKDASGNVSAVYASPVTVRVDTTAPETTISSQPANPTTRRSATFTFSGSDAGSGVASFEGSLDGAAFAACTSPLALNRLAPGSHTFQVRGLDAVGNVDATPASYTWVIEKAQATIALSTLTPTPVPSGTPMTFTARVTVPAGSPTGSVQFLDGPTVLGTSTLASGAASFTTTLLPGTHAITAAYLGDANVSSATSVALSVVVSPSQGTVATLTTSGGGHFGEQAVFTAQVVAGAGTPTGMVTFLEGTTILATVPLASGTAAFTTASLAVGTHAITARYNGDARNPGCLSAPLAAVISAPALAITTATSTVTMNGAAIQTVQLTVSALGTLSAPVTLSATGLPENTSLSFSSATLDSSQLPGTVQVHLKTSSSLQIVGMTRTGYGSGFGAGAGALLACAMLAWPLAHRRRRSGMLLVATLAMLVVGGFTGCAGSGKNQGITNATTPGTYTVTLTATSPGATVATSTLTLIIR